MGVFGAFIEVNGCYFNTNGFYIITMIFSNTVIFFYQKYTVCYFPNCPALLLFRIAFEIFEI